MILGIDPGVTTGVALYAWKDRSYTTSIIKNHYELYDLFKYGGISRVILENFAASRISKYGLHTRSIVGGIEALCYFLDIPITKYQPGQRKAFVSYAVEIVRRKGPDTEIGDTHRHQADALSHILAYQYQEGEIGIDKTGLYFRTDPRQYIVDRR